MYDRHAGCHDQLLFVVEKINPRRKNRGFFYFLAFIAQPPAFAHLAGVGQPLQGLNMIVFFMITSYLSFCACRIHASSPWPRKPFW